ncbi:PEPxxWA-CTERM sorting domain-containing protein [Glacieibacterium frigidum]|uniref:PEP-CTERM sorting domain-containing protein n=1 Tax=Glacieibacterium frigidum TaxID=2593303 RepID=A0A552U7M2_9SPHN|nr:PEPxxWA-CTERM sorting domain-containing protein [Glacieibacterium frigidum]TRW14218.1 PEP-CTERM sorting domain-containing protein [Glacieibacterium frigidum]
MKTGLISAGLLSLLAVPAGAVTFTNPAPIVIPDDAETTSDLTVAGTTGTITGLTLTLNNLSHTFPDDLVFGLLNVTTNLGFVFMSGVGGSTGVSNVTVTFSDAAGDFAPESFVDGALTSGTYLPSNYYGFAFNAFDNATAFADFNGTSANGLWRLYVLDTFAADVGTVAGGWSLDFTLANAAVPEPATWGMMIVGFGLAGTAVRRRRQREHAVTA